MTDELFNGKEVAELEDRQQTVEFDVSIAQTPTATNKYGQLLKGDQLYIIGVKRWRWYHSLWWWVKTRIFRVKYTWRNQ